MLTLSCTETIQYTIDFEHKIFTFISQAAVSDLIHLQTFVTVLLHNSIEITSQQLLKAF